jgi:hypothetical protein
MRIIVLLLLLLFLVAATPLACTLMVPVIMRSEPVCKSTCNSIAEELDYQCRVIVCFEKGIPEQLSLREQLRQCRRDMTDRRLYCLKTGCNITSDPNPKFWQNIKLTCPPKNG